ncbi:InlB B-repeat-containing protein [Clostridioides sp. ZZV14-6154]|uniref:InlB B-repeat-containing protein n=1 Tax=Clostridioides sp. ZZV14-6154 TaxID=2811495 RepID=UPI001D11B3A9|nr:InlB B-repeat-containing protein [Clostridioides sp. ZZV14-6154]
MKKLRTTYKCSPPNKKVGDSLLNEDVIKNINKLNNEQDNINLELSKKASKEDLNILIQLLENSKRYTINYNINLPEGYSNEDVTVPDDMTVLANTEARLDLPSNTDLNEYRFKGWSLAENGDVIERCIATDDITLYAIWYKCINVIYELNIPSDFQGIPIPTIPIDSNKYILGDIITLLPLNNYDENNKEYNYKFCGWSLTENGDVIENATIENEHVQSDGLHLYAVWKKYRYVTYNANFPPEEYPLNRTGEVPVDANRYVEGDIVTVLKNSENNPLGGEEDKDKFLGWTSNIEKAQIPILKSDVEENIVIGKEDITLYGMWGKYRIAYGSNFPAGTGVSGHPPIDQYSYLTGASTVTLSNTGNLNAGSYELIGWSTVKNDESTMLNFGDRIMIDKSNIILQAFWRKL